MPKQHPREEDDTESYKITGVVSTSQVPQWVRRPPKWRRLIDAIAALKPGESLTVVFDNRGAANRARNTVRDNLNLAAGQAVFRTRMADNADGTTTVYFSKLHPSEVVEEFREGDTK